MTLKELLNQWDSIFDSVRKDSKNQPTLEKYFEFLSNFYFDCVLKTIYSLKSIQYFMDNESYTDSEKIDFIEKILNREV